MGLGPGISENLTEEKKMYGADHPELVMTYWNIAILHRRLNMYSKAASYRRKCWEIESSGDGIEDAGVLQTAFYLVRDLFDAEQKDEALAIIKNSTQAVAALEQANTSQKEWIEKMHELQKNHQKES